MHTAWAKEDKFARELTLFADPRMCETCCWNKFKMTETFSQEQPTRHAFFQSREGGLFVPSHRIHHNKTAYFLRFDWHALSLFFVFFPFPKTRRLQKGIAHHATGKISYPSGRVLSPASQVFSLRDRAKVRQKRWWRLFVCAACGVVVCAGVLDFPNTAAEFRATWNQTKTRLVQKGCHKMLH